tara:strand:+ start:562 stop:831 length:270 start_codon:yes stop_codon:yes gene_type:complete
MSVVIKKLTSEQINNYKWVLNNLDNIDWNEPDEDEPYIMCDGWLHGVLHYGKSELEDDLKAVIKDGEVKEIEGQIALDLVVDYCKELGL